MDKCLKHIISLCRNMYNNSIPVDLVPLVYCSALEHGSDKEWKFLWNKFTITNLAAEQKTILNAMGCTKQVHLIKVRNKTDPVARDETHSLKYLFDFFHCRNI